MGGKTKKACPQQLVHTGNECDKYITTLIKITVIRVSIHIIYGNTTLYSNVNGLYISYVASICVMFSVLMFITSSATKGI